MKVIFASRVMFMDLTILSKVSLIFFFMKHKTSKMYIDVTVRILFSLNSYFFIPVINHFFLYIYKMPLCFTWLLRVFLTDLIIKEVLLNL